MSRFARICGDMFVEPLASSMCHYTMKMEGAYKFDGCQSVVAMLGLS